MYVCTLAQLRAYKRDGVTQNYTKLSAFNSIRLVRIIGNADPGPEENVGRTKISEVKKTMEAIRRYNLLLLSIQQYFTFAFAALISLLGLTSNNE